MAAATIASRRDSVLGNKRVVTATATIANNGDTWATGLKVIDAISVDPTTAASSGATVSGGTVTFVTGGALVVSAMVIGN